MPQAGPPDWRRPLSSQPPSADEPRRVSLQARQVSAGLAKAAQSSLEALVHLFVVSGVGCCFPDRFVADGLIHGSVAVPEPVNKVAALVAEADPGLPFLQRDLLGGALPLGVPPYGADHEGGEIEEDSSWHAQRHEVRRDRGHRGCGRLSDLLDYAARDSVDIQFLARRQGRDFHGRRTPLRFQHGGRCPTKIADDDLELTIREKAAEVTFDLGGDLLAALLGEGLNGPDSGPQAAGSGLINEKIHRLPKAGDEIGDPYLDHLVDLLVEVAGLLGENRMHALQLADFHMDDFDLLLDGGR